MLRDPQGHPVLPVVLGGQETGPEAPLFRGGAPDRVQHPPPGEALDPRDVETVQILTGL